jgi:DNA-binding LacI/PurR family transcriptional regulator
MSYLCSMTRAPTRRLADVATKVGVSEATVSRVLNGKPGVSAGTREAVLTALDVLGYERPTQLRGERARLIGLVLPELQNPIFPALAEVVGGALAQRGFTPVLCTRTAGGLSEADYVGMLLDQQVSGVVFAGGHYAEQAAPHEHYRLLRSRGIPVVLFNAAIENLDFPCASTDDMTATGQAHHHLASLGHQRIGLVVGPADHMPSRRKLAAFTELATRSGDGGAPVEHALFSLEGGQAATTRLLRHGITGVICGSDVLALGAIRAVRRAGLSVPGDVSVVGFDDSAFMNCTDPPLTTVRQPIEAMGKAAVAMLVNQIENMAVYPEELLFEPELVVRGSTGRPASAGSRSLGAAVTYPRRDSERGVDRDRVADDVEAAPRTPDRDADHAPGQVHERAADRRRHIGLQHRCHQPAPGGPADGDGRVQGVQGTDIDGQRGLPARGADRGVVDLARHMKGGLPGGFRALDERGRVPDRDGRERPGLRALQLE